MSTEIKKYTLFSSDKEYFEVDESVAKMSQTLKNIIDDGCADNGIPLPIITGRTLAKVIEYCKKHVQSPNTDGDLMAWDSDFLKVDQEMLFNLILASNYLNIRGLLDLTCQTVADMMKDMSAKEVRTAFNIKADLTPEEETEYSEENAWAFK